ncbi:DUF485 domain-containing protein [Streptomyces sp. NPDC051133]|uniref:DUF485 domain-containing protein n=1 Tax=Streptomyces sp. NPDC051133 TaxID=3155521 RepID=UPI00343B337D
MSVSPDPSTPEEGSSRSDGVGRALALHESSCFQELRRAYRHFSFFWVTVSLIWYLLYVLLGMYAKPFMSVEVAGRVNVAFIFGLSQFALTFFIAWRYLRYATRNLDPRATKIKVTWVRTND